MIRKGDTKKGTCRRPVYFISRIEDKRNGNKSSFGPRIINQSVEILLRLALHANRIYDVVY